MRSRVSSLCRHQPFLQILAAGRDRVRPTFVLGWTSPTANAPSCAAAKWSLTRGPSNLGERPAARRSRSRSPLRLAAAMVLPGAGVCCRDKSAARKPVHRGFCSARPDLCSPAGSVGSEGCATRRVLEASFGRMRRVLTPPAGARGAATRVPGRIEVRPAKSICFQFVAPTTGLLTKSTRPGRPRQRPLITLSGLRIARQQTDPTPVAAPHRAVRPLAGSRFVAGNTYYIIRRYIDRASGATAWLLAGAGPSPLPAPWRRPADQLLGTSSARPSP